MTEVRRNENVREATSVTGTSGRVKNKIQYFNRGCDAKQKTFKTFSSVALRHCHTYSFIFFSVREWLARLFAQGLNNLCAAHRFFLVACRRMPSAGGLVRWRAVGWILAEWMVLVHFFS